MSAKEILQWWNENLHVVVHLQEKVPHPLLRRVYLCPPILSSLLAQVKCPPKKYCSRGMQTYMSSFISKRRFHIRVQWFWHFFWNSICFMCFWFGLEILRLVLKKVFFEIWIVSILFDLLSSEKSCTAPYKSWKKKNSSKLGIQGIKRSGILRWFKKCAEVSCLAKGKTNFTEKLNF